MSAQVITIGNNKPGAGKTTLAVHVILSLVSYGYRVCAIDIDPDQRSLSHYLENRKRYMNQRGITLPMPTAHATVNQRSLSTAISNDTHCHHFQDYIHRICQEYDFLVMDTQAFNSFLSRFAHSLANIIITPVNYSLSDIEGEYWSLIERRNDTQNQIHSTPLRWFILRNRYLLVDTPGIRHIYKQFSRLAFSHELIWKDGLQERPLYHELFLRGLSLLDVGEENHGIEVTLPYIAARQELRQFLRTLCLEPVKGLA